MKIDVEGKEIQIKRLKYSEKRELIGYSADVGKTNKARDMEALLGYVSELAFDNPSYSLKKFSWEFQTKILIAILNEYIGESLQVKKDNGD